MNDNKSFEKFALFVYGVSGLIAFIAIFLLAKVGFLNWSVFFLAIYPSIVGLSCFYLIFANKSAQNKVFSYIEKINYIYSYGLIFIAILNKDGFSMSVKYFTGALIIIFTNRFGWRYYWEQERIKEMQANNIELEPKTSSSLSKYENAFSLVIIVSYILNAFIRYVK